MVLLKHPYHLVTPSPWPFLASLSALNLTVGGVLYMHSYNLGGLTLLIGLINVIFAMSIWWRDIIREGTYCGNHTAAVQKSLKIGFLLFIVSEVMFFFSFFWAFFHSSLAPAIEIGGIWPPAGIVAFNPYGIPLLNTYILVLSGATITYTHYSIIINKFDYAIKGFLQTLALAITFTMLQIFEYVQAPFSIADGIYGSTFYMATGFHGFHVLIGTIFIAVCFIRFLNSHFTKYHHIGFEAAAWYWHFVDVVWLFLYISMYWWGGQ